MIETGEGDFSFWNKTFWDLWFQKIFRNFASVKYQWLFLLYIPTLYGMFNEGLTPEQPWISATLGLSFLGGGFVTMALGRLVARTSLKEDTSKDLNIHQQSIKRGEGDTRVVMGNSMDISRYDDPAHILDTDR